MDLEVRRDASFVVSQPYLVVAPVLTAPFVYKITSKEYRLRYRVNPVKVREVRDLCDLKAVETREKMAQNLVPSISHVGRGVQSAI